MADVGNSHDTKFNDTIKAGAGNTRFWTEKGKIGFSGERPMEGWLA